MISGPNRHYIPKFVQKPFGIPPTRKEIWRFVKGEEAAHRPRKRTGSEDDFYTDEVDAAITQTETPLSRIVGAIRSQSIGEAVDPAKAAEIIIHLAPRTAHFRATLERGVRQMGDNAAAILSSPDAVQAMMGLAQDAPNSIFKARVWDLLEKQPEMVALGLPADVIERVAFYLAKENFSTAVGEALPVFRSVFSAWLAQADTAVRDGHNQALVSKSGSNAREEFLQSLAWSIHSGPIAGAVLPDCVTLAITADGLSAPFMLADRKDVCAVIMPLSPDKLLVGQVGSYSIPADYDFNAAAAQSSHSFFLAPASTEETARLHPMIGERATLIVEDAVRGVMEQLVPAMSAAEDEEEPFDPFQSDHSDDPAQSWQYELSLLQCGEKETTDRIVDAVRNVIAELSPAVPLRRLDGITIAYDYPAALAALDRGFENARTPETISNEIGVGIAQMVTVRRDGQVKGRVMMSSSVAYALIDEDPAQVEWAIHVFVKELAQVAMIDIIEHALPGIHLTPVQDEFQGWLYGNVDAALHGYVTSYIAAGFGDPQDIQGSMREVLILTIERMRRLVLKERLQYRYHGDLDRLMSVAFPAVRNVLTFAADLLGQCAATGTSPFDDGGALARTLDEVGLTNWFSLYSVQLEKFRSRVGRWQSFDEFLSFTVHVERLLWQLGMLPWQGPEGLRVEVPVGTDMAALVAAESDVDSAN